MYRKGIYLMVIFALLLSLCPGAAAQETEPSSPTEPPAPPAVPIYTVEDLMKISEDPYGSYILMADLDMTGLKWKAIDFFGTFDGNGHGILNLNLAYPGEETPEAFDGNRKPYDIACFGFFGTMRDAQVKNLQLLNVRSAVEWDGPVFMGAIAGFAENCTIFGCSVSGTLELRAQDRFFGLAGLVGYGIGRMEHCNVDVTLINVDTDAETKDEQFLGGLFAVGFYQVFDTQLKLDGYVSDHGYVHSGGVVGMYTQYPWTYGECGYVLRSTIAGKVTFFEDNRDRRAYCDALAGESMLGWIFTEGTTTDFLRDERFEYDRELRPEMCDQPGYKETVTAPDCEHFGYTTYSCISCGYTYTDRYTLKEHAVSEWTLVQEPTVEQEGLSLGYCACGMEHTRAEPKLTPPATEAPETEESTAPEQEALPAEPQSFPALAVTAAGLGILALVLLPILLRKKP